MKSHSHSIFNLFILIVLLTSLLGNSVTPAYAATWTVTITGDSGPGSLRQAILDAAADETITFDAALSGGTIYLASPLILTKNVIIDGSALASKIMISGDTDNNGTGDVQVFYVNTSVAATLNSLMITKGMAANEGGGVNINTGGSLSITNSVLYGNSAGFGGGVYNLGALTITNTTISNNNSTNVSVGGGGGIYNTGSLTITNSTLSGNSAAGNTGGGIYNNAGGSLTVTNSTLSGNSSANQGGGIYSTGALTMTNSTLSGNSAATSGGGVYVGGGTLNYTNTIIANSSSGSDCGNSGTIATNINNLVKDGSCSAGGINFKTGNPNLGALADNGGPTQTLALLASSPAIDAGSDTACAAPPVNNLDQRGMTRFQGLHCDIGAYESGLLITVVNSAADTDDYYPGDGICETFTPGECTLRAAIQETNATLNTAYGPDEITFNLIGEIPPYPIYPGSSLPTIAESVKIDGANKIALNGTNAGINTDGLTLNTNDSIIANLTITNFSGAGVVVANSALNTGNQIKQNNIYNNGLVDIDLGDDGVTFNHVGSAPGANNYQNYPVLMLATSTGSSLRVVGALKSAVDSNYTIDIYSNQSCHPTFFGGGQTYLGSFNVTTNGSGFAKFDRTLAVAVVEPNGVTATATGSGGTSEFSYCQPASTENLNWVQAQWVESGSSTQQYITNNYQEKWFKFSVQPGDTVHIKLTNLAGSAVSLHTDPHLIYNELINPTDEAALSAEAAGSAFLPSGSLPSGSLPSGSLPSGSLAGDFLPSGSLPSGSLPSGSLPSGSLPSGSLPSGSLPSGSLPSGSLPSGSLPSGSLPSGSLPSGSLPSGSLPSGSLPSGSLPSGSLDAYASAARQSLIGISMNPYTPSQNIDRNTYDYMGDLYVRVVGRYNLQSPFTLDVTVDAGVCNAIQPVPDGLQVINGSAPSGSYKSLILTDSSRLEGAPAEIITALAKLQTLAARSDVAGIVINLTDAQYERVAWANTQADANLACPSAKNMAADEIKNVIGEYRTANPTTLEYIVLAGGANVIPYFQVQDVAGLADEKDYVVPVKPSTASEAGLQSNLVQGQDSYGSQVEITQGGYKLAYPGLAVGRLVDTASDISLAIDAYIAADGVITPSSSLITGYDFVGDAADAIKTEMEAGTGSSAEFLIQAPGGQPTDPSAWTAEQLRTKLLANNFDIAVLTGHFSAGNLLAADYETQLTAEEIFYSAADLNHVLFLTLGCHGGYTIPKPDMLNFASPDPDWAKTLLRKGAAGYISATGYAYGDTELTEYGERLFLLMAKELRTGNDPVSTGYAMMQAKRKYLEGTAQLTGIDQKTIIEMTLYGLPMMKVNMPGARITPVVDASIISGTDPVAGGPGAALGLGNAPAWLLPTVTLNTKQLNNNGSPVTTTYLSGVNGVIANPFEPILPKELYDVSVAGEVLRGVAFRGGTYTDQPSIIPLTTAPTTETSTGHPSFNAEFFYPTQPWITNFFDALFGGDTRLVVFPAQFKSSAPGAIDGILRKFSGLDLLLYYFPSNWTTSTDPVIIAAGVSAAPNILGVSADENNSRVATFHVNASADGSAGVQAVWVVYTGLAGSPYHGTWSPLDLTQNSDDPTLWEGTLDLAPLVNAEDVQFMVQAVGGAGLTVLDTNRGAYYSVAPYNIAPPPPVETTLTLQSPPTSGIYRKNSVFNLLLTSGANPVPDKLVTLDIGGQQALAITNISGQATITLNLNIPPGNYTAQAGFSGDSARLSSTASSAFVVNKDSTAITTQVSPISAILKNSSGNGLPGKSLVFFVHNATDSFSRSVVTNHLGGARLGFVPLPPGDYAVDVNFSGTIPYESSSQSGLPLTISEWHEVRPPTITASAATADSAPYTAGVWTNQSVTVHFDCADTLSGVASCPADQVFDTSGSFTADGTATDNAGNSASASFGPIKIDKIAPTLAPSILPTPIYLKAIAIASANAADSGSGVASQNCGPVVTSRIGSRKVTCTAADVAGNMASVDVPYRVIYKFTGFYAPVHKLPALNRMQAGQAVKIVFSLKGFQGMSVVAAGYPRSNVVACGSGKNYTIATVTATSSGLKYNSSTRRYTYTWKTNPTWAGACRQFSIKLKDGSIYKLKFKFIP